MLEAKIISQSEYVDQHEFDDVVALFDRVGIENAK